MAAQSAGCRPVARGPDPESVRNQEMVDLGALWIDRPDALQRLDGMMLDARTRDDVEHFIRHGYVILRECVDPALADRVLADALAMFEAPQRYVVRESSVYIDPGKIRELAHGHRIIDLYEVSPAARDAAFAPHAANFLRAVFGEPAIGIQSLFFEYGSQQAIHQDTAYVVSRKPLALAAAWIALEDVAQGTGELIYYPGGHRFPHYFFNNGASKAWSAGRDGTEVHQRYLRHLHVCAKEAAIKLDRFLPRKGDVLIWHADLPHGGSLITQSRTRRSLVVHFVPKSVKAYYQTVIGRDYYEFSHPSGHLFTSRHFALKKVDRDGRAPILFDNGISAERAERHCVF